MSVKELIGVGRERMNIYRETPELSRAMVALDW
jgi:hypothetical protein